MPPQTTYIIFMEIRVEEELITDPITDELTAGVGPALEEDVDATIIERRPSVQGLPGSIVP